MGQICPQVPWCCVFQGIFQHYIWVQNGDTSCPHLLLDGAASVRPCYVNSREIELSFARWRHQKGHLLWENIFSTFATETAMILSFIGTKDVSEHTFRAAFLLEDSSKEGIFREGGFPRLPARKCGRGKKFWRFLVSFQLQMGDILGQHWQAGEAFGEEASTVEVLHSGYWVPFHSHPPVSQETHNT